MLSVPPVIGIGGWKQQRGNKTVAAMFSQRAHAQTQQRHADTSAAPVGVPTRQRQRRHDTQQRAPDGAALAPCIASAPAPALNPATGPGLEGF